MRLPSLWNSRDVADPFRAMRREMDDLFSNFARRWPTMDLNLDTVAVDIAETKDAYEVTAELPGVDQNDIKLSIDGNRIVISGEKKKESETKDKDWHTIERSYGSFTRSFSLPPTVDAERTTATRPRSPSGTCSSSMVRFRTEFMPMATRDRVMKAMASQMSGASLKMASRWKWSSSAARM